MIASIRQKYRCLSPLSLPTIKRHITLHNICIIRFKTGTEVSRTRRNTILAMMTLLGSPGTMPLPIEASQGRSMTIIPCRPPILHHPRIARQTATSLRQASQAIPRPCLRKTSHQPGKAIPKSSSSYQVNNLFLVRRSSLKSFSMVINPSSMSHLIPMQ